MKQIVVFIFLSVFSSLMSFASSEDNRIVNGTPAEDWQNRATVSLFYETYEYNGVFYNGAYCAGTIIDEWHVVTAAHCVTTYYESSLFTVVVPQIYDESDYPYGNIERHRVEKVFYPDSFINSTAALLRDDIAVLKLETPMNIDTAQDVVPIPSHDAYRLLSGNFIAVGHGNTRSGYDASSELLATTLQLVSNQVCATVFSAGEYLTQRQICFDGAYNNGTGLKNSTCQGDSGGPVFTWQDGRYVQVGITSFGPTTCGDPQWAVTSVFTELYDFKGWVEQVIAGEIEPKVTLTEQERIQYFENNVTLQFQQQTVGDASAFNRDEGSSIGWLTLFGLFLAAMTRLRHRAAQIKHDGV